MPQKNGQYSGPSTDPLINSITSGYRWDTSTGYVINWAISDGFNQEFWTNRFEVINTMNAAFLIVSDYTNLEFNYLGYFSNPAAALLAGADINISMDGAGAIFDDDRVWAIGIFPKPEDLNRGDIYLNVNSAANTLEYTLGSEGFFLLLHELGHALGLKHPHDDGGTLNPTFAELGNESLDSDIFTVMSYNDDHQWNRVAWNPATFMPIDVIGLQYLYGINQETNFRDNTYTLVDDGLYSTIWDADGDDVITTSATEGWIVQLPEHILTTSETTAIGFATPMDQIMLDSPLSLKWFMGDIEHAIGNEFNDVLVGNRLGNVLLGKAGDDVVDGGAGDDVLSGGPGDDLIVGEAGLDVAFYDTKASEAVLSWKDGEWLISTPDEGDDVVSGIELLDFGGHFVPTLSKAHDSYDTIPDDLWFFFLVAFNGAPGVTYMDWMLDRMSNGKSIESFIDVFVTAPEFKDVYPESMTSQLFAEALVVNTLRGTAAQVYEDLVVEKIVKMMNEGADRGDVIYNVIGDMKWISPDSLVWGKAAKLFANQKAVARFYTDEMSQSTIHAGTLRSVLANVTYDSDLSSEEKIVDLIGVSLLEYAELIS